MFALSCWTANGHGVGLTVREIRKRHTGAHMVVGGPPATQLPREMMRHYPSYPSYPSYPRQSAGESEGSFMEIVERLGQEPRPKRVAGTWYRKGRLMRPATA